MIHRENLVRPMVNGYKVGNPDDGIRYKHGIVAAVLLLAVVGFWVTGPESFPLPWNGPSQAAAVRDHAVHRDPD